MQDLNDLYYYSQVVDHGGFARAERALGIPKSKLSRRVSMLEERLGVRLIQRSTRHFSVTEIGQTFHAHCKAMLVEAESALNAIEFTRSEPRGIVRLACPVTLLDTRVGEMIAAFMVQCPGVEVHLEATNRRVDLVAENIDVALRVRPPPLEDSDLVMRVLAERRQCLVASPALLERAGTPQNEYLWTLLGPDGARAEVLHRPRLVTRGMLTLRSAALAGVGVVQLPKMMVREHFQDGSLVHVLPDWAPRREIIHAVFPSRRGLLPSVRSLIDFLVERFRQIEEE
jgi:DNA-binding transcriptional LysR family regulator